MSRAQEQLVEIARRRERLIARAETQRLAIATNLGALRRPIGVIDSGLAAARYLRGHPLLVAAIFATFAVFRRRSLLSVAGRALSVWRLWRVVSTWVA